MVAKSWLGGLAIALLAALMPSNIACTYPPGSNPEPTPSIHFEEAWGSDGCLYFAALGKWWPKFLCRTYPIAGSMQVVNYHAPGAANLPFEQYDTRTPGQVIMYDFSSKLKTMYYTNDPAQLYVASNGQWVSLVTYLAQLRQAQLETLQQQTYEQLEKLKPKNTPTQPGSVSGAEALAMVEASRNRMTEIVLAPPCTYSHNGCGP
ncbi:hypothetical protein [Streptomyces virginiae]|uniref:hypothetical protein n=1 Tax=Streptomyces virginiae TaxID=1961 RepID=UPI0037BD75C8